MTNFTSHYQIHSSGLIRSDPVRYGIVYGSTEIPIQLSQHAALIAAWGQYLLLRSLSVLGRACCVIQAQLYLVEVLYSWRNSNVGLSSQAGIGVGAGVGAGVGTGVGTGVGPTGALEGEAEGLILEVGL